MKKNNTDSLVPELPVETRAKRVRGPNGGKREGAGRKPGIPETSVRKQDKAAIAQTPDVLTIDRQYVDLSPLDCLLMAMRHYATKNQWMQAALLADKAAKYCHPPISAINSRGNDHSDISKLDDETLKKRAAEEERIPLRRAA